MSAGKQVAAVVGMNVQAMRSRIAASLVIVVGMAAVVAVTLSVFSLSAGLTRMTKVTSAPDRMSISSKGTVGGQAGQAIPRDSLSTLADTPGIKKGSDGKPLIYGNVGGPPYITRKKENGIDVGVTFQGVGSNILEVRPELKIVQGRMFTSGLREIVAGKGAVERFEGIALGAELRFQDGPWTVVGISDSSGGTSDYSLMADAETVASAFRRGAFNSVFARLDEGTKSAQDAFKAALTSNPSVSVDVETEEESRTRTTKSPREFYAFLSLWVGGIMGLGAFFAAVNTMYAAVSARVIEIATLRAIGFGAMPVVVSVVLEALALAACGAALGALIAWTIFDGRDQNYASIAIIQDISPMMVAAGIGLSLLVGLIGALFPAVRAARIPVTVALQTR